MLHTSSKDEIDQCFLTFIGLTRIRSCRGEIVPPAADKIVRHLPQRLQTEKLWKIRHVYDGEVQV